MGRRAGKPKSRVQKKKINRKAVTWRGKTLREMSKQEIEAALKRLEEGWRAELPPRMLCTFTGLTEDMIEEIKRRNPKMAALEAQYDEYLKTCSRISVARDIIECDDVQTAKWYLEHMDDDFKPASKIDMRSQAIVVPVEKKEAEILKLFEEYFDESTEGVAGEQESELSEMADGSDSEAL